jgi:hypothetical protein
VGSTKLQRYLVGDHKEMEMGNDFYFYRLGFTNLGWDVDGICSSHLQSQRIKQNFPFKSILLSLLLYKFHFIRRRSLIN